MGQGRHDGRSRHKGKICNSLYARDHEKVYTYQAGRQELLIVYMQQDTMDTYKRAVSKEAALFGRQI